MRQPELDDVTQLVLVQPPPHRPHQGHRQAGLGAVVQRLPLALAQVLAPDLEVRAFVEPVEPR